MLDVLNAMTGLATINLNGKHNTIIVWDTLKDQTELQKGFTIKVPLTVNTSPFKII